MYQPTLVVTRFELKHWWYAPLLRLWFWRISRDIRATTKTLHQSILLRESSCCYVTLSIWSEPHQMVISAVSAHVQAVRLSRKWCKAIWTTQWHLTRVSSSAHSWPNSGVDWWGVAQSAGVGHGWAGAGTACNGHAVNIWRRRVRTEPGPAPAAPGLQPSGAEGPADMEPDCPG